MKNIKYLITISSVILMLLGCDDRLDTAPVTSIAAGNFFKNQSDMEAGLIGAYDVLQFNINSNPGGQSWGTMMYWDVLTPVARDRFAPGGSLGTLSTGSHDTGNGHGGGIWNNAYTGIDRSNFVIANIDKAEFTDSNEPERAVIEGEARFLRAMNYYMLLEFFNGEVPILTKPATVDDAILTNLGNRAAVVQLLKDDLDFAVANLDVVGRDVGRATRGAALTLRMKVELADRNWEAAANYAQQVIDLGVYALQDNYEDVVTAGGVNDNNQEIIFDVQFVGGETTDVVSQLQRQLGNRSSVGSGFSRINGTFWLTQQYEVIGDPTDVSQYDNTRSNGTIETNIPDEIHELFAARDPRMDINIIRPGARFLDRFGADVLYPFEIRAFNHSTTGIHLRKYVHEADNDGAGLRDDDTNVVIFRYADVLLARAEALARIGTPSDPEQFYPMINNTIGAGALDQATLDATVNKVRMRASNQLPLHTAGSITYRDIYMERVRELAHEGWSYFDFTRSGMIKERDGFSPADLETTNGSPIVLNLGALTEEIFDPNRHYYLPIPSGEVQQGSGIEQVPAWE